MRVSVIIPVHNAAWCLGEQLAALSRQMSAPPFEVVVVDNGSTDESQTVAESWRSRLPYLTITRATERQCAAHARNVGALAARGELLLFCDADDVVSDTWVSDFVRHEAEGDLLSGWLEFERLNPELPDHASVQKDLTVYFDYLPGIAGSNFAVSRQTYLALGGMDESLFLDEDVDLAWRAQEAGLSVLAVPAVVHYRLRGDARSLYRQFRGYAEASILLWLRFQDRPVRPIGFRGSVTHLVRQAISV